MTSQQTEEYIYKICSIKNWKIAKQIGAFKGFGIDLIDGYIHFSSKDQVKETARLHFNGEKELLLLKIKTKNLEIKWEKSRKNQNENNALLELNIDSKDLKNDSIDSIISNENI